MLPAAMSHTLPLASIPGPDRGHLSVIALDTLVSAVHFPPDTAAADAAWKSLAVNLSDLAAMGADPSALQAHCEAPRGDAQWLREVAAGLADAAREFALPLQVRDAPGATRRISVQAIGSVPRAGVLTRAGAHAGDELWVSGTLGDAGAGLAVAQGRLHVAPGPGRDHLLARLARPSPRLALGRALRGVASAAIDVSDGIVGDAGHLARRSGVAIRIHADDLPLSAALCAAVDAGTARALALRAGDDYELLFCAPREHASAVRAAARTAGIEVRVIGAVLAGAGVTLADRAGRPVDAGHAYQHFSGDDR